jgi:pimeloyl-ACP methyl ester carboxylesterase
MKSKLPSRPAINERRAYFECSYGQLHVRTAFPSTGGFDERTPLLCLHDLGSTSASFAGLISLMGTDRSIYAIDLLGHGESDPAPKGADVAAFAEAVGDLVSGLRLREVDVVGQGFGGAVAVELAAIKASVVRSVVLVDAPTAAPAPWPTWPANEEGADLEQIFRAGRAQTANRESLHGYILRFAEVLRGGGRISVAREALGAWPALERLRQLKHRVLAVDTGRRRPQIADQIPTGRSLDGSAWPVDALVAPSAELAERLRTFLDSPN